MRKIIAAALLAVAPLCAQSWPEEPDGFKGVQFGADPKQARPALKAMGCSVPYRGHYCKAVIEGGGFVITGFLIFHDTGFIKASGSFPPENYEDMRAIFIKKYGNPHSARQSVLQNRLGASFQQEDLASILFTLVGQTIALRGLPPSGSAGRRHKTIVCPTETSLSEQHCA
jgi:hypothetical protein